MDIGAVLSRAWQIVWRHKVLWLFGILAGCASSGGSGGSNFRMESNQPNPQMEQWFRNFQFQMEDWQVALLIGAFLLVMLFIIVIATFLGTMGQVGLFRGAYQADQGAAHLQFGELFSGSLPYFWRVFLLNLIVGLILALAIIILIVPLALTVIGLVCVLPLLCLLIPLGWLVSVVLKQASIAIVVEDLGIMAGLQRGWDVVRDHIGTMIVMALILLVIGLVGGFIVGLPVLFFAGPLILGAIQGSNAALGTGLLISALCFVAYLPVLLLLNGIVQSYVNSAWTLTFLRLTGRAPAASAL